MCKIVTFDGQTVVKKKPLFIICNYKSFEIKFSFRTYTAMFVCS